MHDQHTWSAVKIPADIDKEDRLLGPLTARQVAILAATAAVLWPAFMATQNMIPLPVFAVAATPVLAVACALATVRRDGVGLDRLLLAAVRQRLAPRRLVPTTVPVASPPSFVPSALGATARPLPAPLNLPATGISDDGVISLAGEGCAVLVACTTVSFALATPAEQEGMVASFARCLNSLTAPVQIVVRAERVDLRAHLRRLEQTAPGLPHPELERAARDHASFLADLAGRAELLWRQVLLVVREPVTTGRRDSDTSAIGAQVRRQAEQITRSLAAAGIAATVLDGAAVENVLTVACDPYRSGGSR